MKLIFSNLSSLSECIACYVLLLGGGQAPLAPLIPTPLIILDIAEKFIGRSLLTISEDIEQSDNTINNDF